MLPLKPTNPFHSLRDDLRFSLRALLAIGAVVTFVLHLP